MPDLPFSALRVPQHVECYFDRSALFFFFFSHCSFSTNGPAFQRTDLLTKLLLRGSTGPRGLVCEWETLSLHVYNRDFSPLACVSMWMAAYLLANSIPFVKCIGRRHK